GFVNGILPKNEDNYNGLARKVVWGKYLSDHDQGVLVAQDLARYLGIIRIDTEIVFSADSSEQKTEDKITLLNDTLTIIGSGYQGITAAGKFAVTGILKFPTSQENGSMIYMTLENAQYTFSPYVPDLVTSVAIDLENRLELNETEAQLKASLNPSNYDVMLWSDMMKEIVQGIQSDNISGLVMLGILYMIVGFGLLGTVLMMTMERRREMAVMIAVGLQRTQLALILSIESIVLGVLGVLGGILFSYPFIYYLYLHPIPLKNELADMMNSYNMEPVIPFSMNFSIFYYQALVVFGITLLIALYPLVTAFRLKLIQAFHK
ncbi:MAG: FtsX-like permease family protein, partial [Bacteroidales bacterium]|nr:FtsX-like permease family protein [Bacteroidales bacterium]